MELFRHWTVAANTRTEYGTNRVLVQDLYGRCAALIAGDGAMCDGIAPPELEMQRYVAVYCFSSRRHDNNVYTVNTRNTNGATPHSIHQHICLRAVNG